MKLKKVISGMHKKVKVDSDRSLLFRLGFIHLNKIFLKRERLIKSKLLNTV